MVGVIRTVATSFKRSHDALLPSGSSKCSLKQVALKRATDDPPLCRRLQDTHGYVWVSFLWGHCSFLLASPLPSTVSANYQLFNYQHSREVIPALILRKL